MNMGQNTSTITQTYEVAPGTLSRSKVPYPPFELGKPRFDQSTYLGRLTHILDTTDPKLLLTPNEKVECAVEFLEDYKNGTAPKYSDEQLWQWQRIKNSFFHPDTGEKIYAPFRMAGFVPFGSPIVIGLLWPNPSFAATIFWQWLNQTHNACFNYSHRNASKHTPFNKYVEGYAGAVTSAVTIAVSLQALIKRAHVFSPTTKMLIQRFIPFPAVASANICNVVLMRKNELEDGIEVLDDQNNVVGTSKIAAKRALTETAITRVVLPIPILIFPPIIMSVLERSKYLTYNRGMRIFWHSIVVTACFAIALPHAIALFPQNSQINVNELEDEFKDKTDQTVLYYNKGL